MVDTEVVGTEVEALEVVLEAEDLEGASVEAVALAEAEEEATMEEDV